jgi:hypothetical protein
MKTEKTHTPSIVLIVRKGDPLTIIPSALTDEGFAWCGATAETLAPQISALGEAVMQTVEAERKKRGEAASE